MELYVLTQAGAQAIPLLRKTGRALEADILDYAGRAEGATVEQIAEAMHLDAKVAYDKVRSLSANKWLWLKSTKLVPF